MEDELKSEYVKILVTSFNMGAKTLDFEKTEERDSVFKRIEETVPPGYDVYICGAQELVDEMYFTIIDKTLTKRGFRRTTTTPARVSGRGDGSFLNAKHTTIAIFISDNHKDKIKVRKCYSCSLGRMEGSKGAASLLLDIAGTTLAFLCCHLSSNLPRDKQKNYRKMIQEVGALGDKYFSILSQVHHVVVFGDLNYRIMEISAEEVLREITREGSSKTLWKYDTLKKDMRKQMAFTGFIEPRPRLDFLPTYKKKPNRIVEIKKFKSGKLDVKSDNSWLYDVYRTKYKEPMYKGGNVQDRIPSFTDRLLVHSMRTHTNLKFERDSMPYLFQNHRDSKADNYGCIYGLTFSDHTPIYAGFRIVLPHIMRRPPYEFDGEQPKSYRLQLMNIQVKPLDQKKVEIRSIRTLFPLPYENRNTKADQSKKVDFSYMPVAEDDNKSQLLEPSSQPVPKKGKVESLESSKDSDMLTLDEMLKAMAKGPPAPAVAKSPPKREREHPPIEVVYNGPVFRDMMGGLHCLVKITLTDGNEPEGGFFVRFSDFEEDPKQKKKPRVKVVAFKLFLKGRRHYGKCQVEVQHDFVSRKI